MDTLRLFLALDLSTEAKAALADVQAFFRAAPTAPPALANARWVRPAGTHLTLHFFGDVPADQLAPITDSCCAGLASALPTPLSLRLAGLGAFPDRQLPRVLWAGITGDVDGLTELYTAVARLLEARGYPSRHAVFRPHLTIGRLAESLPEPERAAAGAAFSALAEEAATAFAATPPFELHEAVLYRSLRQAGGSVYEAVARWPIGSRRLAP